MLMRIFLIIAIVAGLAAGAVNIFVVKNKITVLTADRNTQRDQKVQAQTELASTKKELGKTKTDLAQTQQQLTDSESARKKAEQAEATEKKRADDLNTKLAQTTQERDTAQSELEAYKITGTAQQFASMSKTLQKAQDEIDGLNGEKAVLQRKLDRLQVRLQRYEGSNTVVTLRADLHGKIVSVDPKWDFVVLNIGQDQGVKPDGELLVSRDGKLVAKVVVTTLEKDRCIANIVPGWKLGEVFEGDDVSPAHPAS